MITHRFDVGKLLLSALSYKGTIFPGAALRRVYNYTAKDYDNIPYAPFNWHSTQKGTPIYKQDPLRTGMYYFMPVVIGGVELPYGVISVTGKKTVVETAIVGGKGTVKELISVDDYKISLAGILTSEEGVYPEESIVTIRELYNRNESIRIECALTELILDGKEDVIITSIDFPAMNGVENMQIVKLECITDFPFELEIE